MKKKEQTTWTSITSDLKNAALLPQQRAVLLSRALQQMSTNLAAVGTALVWPCKEKKVPWKGYYEGSKRDVMHPWLAARLGTSIDGLIDLLQRDSTNNPLETSHPLLLPLRISSAPPSGLWVIWLPQAARMLLDGPVLEYIEHVRQLLEAVLEVESREEQYFSQSSPLSDRELIETLAHGSNHALSAFLSLRVLSPEPILLFGLRHIRMLLKSPATWARNTAISALRFCVVRALAEELLHMERW